MIIALPPVDREQAELGRRIRAIREARGLSLGRLAEEAHLGALRVSLAERGRVRLNSGELHAVICALHIPLGLLFSEADVSRLRPL